jgi:4-carboxymuconolactone decarboxylase
MKAKASRRPPKAYADFMARFPKVVEAWDTLRQAEESGPLDEKSVRLVKLAIAVGAQHTGAVHSAVRKALAAGASRAEIEQVVALAPSTIGFPPTVAVHTWIKELLPPQSKRR